MPPAPTKKRNNKQTTLFSFAKKIKTNNNNDSNNDNNCKPSYKIFCDLDGVLVDFDKGVEKLTGKTTKELVPYQLWGAINRTNNFYLHLPWTSDGEELWEYIRPYKPNILTGVPKNTDAPRDKFQWCKRELCVEVTWKNMAASGKQHKRVINNNEQTKKNDNSGVCTVITCWSKNKHCESRPGHVLIDDRIELKDDWENSGGIFIHHTDTSNTIKTLQELGILNNNNNNEKQQSDPTIIPKKCIEQSENISKEVISDDTSKATDDCNFEKTHTTGTKSVTSTTNNVLTEEDKNQK